MGKFLDYNPDQAYLLPPSVRDVLGEGHLCFFLRRVVGWAPSRRCARGERAFGERFAVGRSSAMRRTPTKARARKSAGRRWRGGSSKGQKFRRGWSVCKSRG